MSTVVVIPAYNPGESLPTLVRELTERGMSVLVVNDGSTVGLESFDEVTRLGVVVLAHPRNRGKGAALKTAFRYLLDCGFAGVVVTADADGQHLPSDIERVAGTAAQSPDSLVLGVRDVASMPGRSRLGNSVTSWLVAARYGVRVCDTQTGLRAFCSGSLPDAISITGERYEYEMGALLAARHTFSSVLQVPIQTVYEPGNASSHFSPVMDSLRILRLVLVGHA